MSRDDELKLLGTKTCPFAIRVRIALNQKGLSYEFLVEDVKNKSELLLKSNPVHKKIPVFIHNGRSICESLVILQYIDENWSGTSVPSLLPTDPYERAMARFWAVFIDDKLFSSWMGVLKATAEDAKAEKIAETIAGLKLLEGALKDCSDGKCFYGGDSIGYLDVVLGSHLIWLRTVEKMSGAKLFDETVVPLLLEWEKHFIAVDCVNSVMPSVEMVQELVKTHLLAK
ncbi:hypothetical protein LUZ63_019803 [Rhynchospora breviuscula]|uniref:Glutathione S-transferase n=1 Tax=Rhynchospora breviuscula TaxID=2022672 RepID=A0A9Q0C6Y8_9POAL|nr:hypothetical protein LUZ63_019803 [Rhynchospora breviuscula]